MSGVQFYLVTENCCPIITHNGDCIIVKTETPTGQVCPTATSKKPDGVATGKAPGITATGKLPTITATGKSSTSKVS